MPYFLRSLVRNLVVVTTSLGFIVGIPFLWIFAYDALGVIPLALISVLVMTACFTVYDLI